jgi:hypothetical protein
MVLDRWKRYHVNIYYATSPNWATYETIEARYWTKRRVRRFIREFRAGTQDDLATGVLSPGAPKLTEVYWWDGTSHGCLLSQLISEPLNWSIKSITDK